MSPAAAAAAVAPSYDRIHSYEDFARVHAYLLAASGVPPSLHQRLPRKLADEVFDGGEVFSVEPCEGGKQRRLVLAAERPLGRESDVFLVDHAWSFRLSDELKQCVWIGTGELRLKNQKSRTVRRVGVWNMSCRWWRKKGLESRREEVILQHGWSLRSLELMMTC